MTEPAPIRKIADDLKLSLETLTATKRKRLPARPLEAMAHEWRSNPPEISVDLLAQHKRRALEQEAEGQ